ncbi:hypothetical protein J6590_076510 [Homalodisca vitripennis]|nr:hypothetical protein J6590_076510 [Homalodisca vitripennis]
MSRNSLALKREAKTKKKKKYKKKAPKPRRPRPGQVHIATALDGTTLFCCPECNMAYPDKELLEQHLVAHKIERSRTDPRLATDLRVSVYNSRERTSRSGSRLLTVESVRSQLKLPYLPLAAPPSVTSPSSLLAQESGGGSDADDPIKKNMTPFNFGSSHSKDNKGINSGTATKRVQFWLAYPSRLTYSKYSKNQCVGNPLDLQEQHITNDYCSKRVDLYV